MDKKRGKYLNWFLDAKPFGKEQLLCILQQNQHAAAIAKEEKQKFL